MIWQDVYTTLHGTSSISNLVSTRIYPTRLPESPTYPAITISQVSGDFPTVLSGKESINNPSIQIDVWDTSFSELKTLAGYVQTAMNSATLFKSVQINEIDIEETETLSTGGTLYRVMAEYSVWVKA